MPLCDGLNCFHVAWDAKGAYGEDGLRTRGDEAFDLVWVEVKSAFVDVAEDRPNSIPIEDMGSGWEREGRRDNLAVANLERMKGDKQGHCSVAKEVDVFYTKVLGKGALEFVMLRSVVGELFRFE